MQILITAYCTGKEKFAINKSGNTDNYTLSLQFQTFLGKTQKYKYFNKRLHF